MSVSIDWIEEVVSVAVELWNTGHPRSYIINKLQDEYELSEADAKQLAVLAETLTYDIKRGYKK